MPVTFTDAKGTREGPSGAGWREQQKKRSGAGGQAPAPSAKQEEADGVFVVKEEVWVEIAPGRHQKIHRAGDRIPEAEAERLGLLTKKVRAVEDKKAPRASDKRTTRANQE